ncbi:hypothetical protein B0H14DRAFT_3887416 [Mycena olivaceomarginata]|nr:hypothetical protein B0H14DRAFT_3887416 [Mycena olivaceomarginata]
MDDERFGQQGSLGIGLDDATVHVASACLIAEENTNAVPEVPDVQAAISTRYSPTSMPTFSSALASSAVASSPLSSPCSDPSDFIAAPAAQQSKWLRVLFTRARTDDVLVSVLHKTVSLKSASTIRPPSRSTDAAAPPTTIRIDRWSWTSVRRRMLGQSTRNRCRLRTRGYDALMHLDDALALKPARCKSFHCHRHSAIAFSLSSTPTLPRASLASHTSLGVELEHPNPHPLSLARRKASKGDILVITLRNGIDVLVAGRVLHVLAPARILLAVFRCYCDPFGFRAVARAPMCWDSGEAPASAAATVRIPDGVHTTRPARFPRVLDEGPSSARLAGSTPPCTQSLPVPEPLHECLVVTPSNRRTLPLRALEVEYCRRRECPGAGRLKAKGSRHMLDEGCVKMLLSSAQRSSSSRPDVPAVRVHCAHVPKRFRVRNLEHRQPHPKPLPFAHGEHDTCLACTCLHYALPLNVEGRGRHAIRHVPRPLRSCQDGRTSHWKNFALALPEALPFRIEAELLHEHLCGGLKSRPLLFTHALEEGQCTLCPPRFLLGAASRFKICIPAALHDCDPELTIMLLRDPRLPLTARIVEDIGTSPSLILLPPSYSTPFLPILLAPSLPSLLAIRTLSPSLLHDTTAVVEAMLSVCPVRVTVFRCAAAVSCRRSQAGEVLDAVVRDVGPARGPVPVLVVSLRSPTHLLASPPFCDSACPPPMLSSPHSSPFLSRLPVHFSLHTRSLLQSGMVFASHNR